MLVVVEDEPPGVPLELEEPAIPAAGAGDVPPPPPQAEIAMARMAEKPRRVMRFMESGP
jgi:hypothetical protein